MPSPVEPLTLPFLAPGEDFPPPRIAWDASTDAPGLLCAGADLTVATLVRAYRQGIFPWYALGQPILWWNPDPRMVLDIADFRLHPSLRKTLRRFARTPGCTVRIDSAFGEVIRGCAQTPRHRRLATWILPAMVIAYEDLHCAGLAHSVETWVDGQLVGGLYFVAIGKAVFGESMFHRASDASKIALAALVCCCIHRGIDRIDCQQDTRHLASLGARCIPRQEFLAGVAERVRQPSPLWAWDDAYWQALWPAPVPLTSHPSRIGRGELGEAAS
ncbi:leucyl/phenylalanyl-tRNA--protein transferase [Candidatus Symbiobacter mobilis]|uniref:Leucyl/phenylalanyl-tRNA--protein transferase n=1 Tax=Candidatus Symbiobacter mobilis CR TaxID=946483 RepID=U5N557_9BURK|nr:leucyl/phenylalanyl-tRNA--protein transferase [Candidatus Symbiobacter mobilis]AGX86656.1 leucyl/phenylalanyl-tRNA--protein transferase [Candidatus Symbiobacter mobilis CR]